MKIDKGSHLVSNRTYDQFSCNAGCPWDDNLKTTWVNFVNSCIIFMKIYEWYSVLITDSTTIDWYEKDQ